MDLTFLEEKYSMAKNLASLLNDNDIEQNLLVFYYFILTDGANKERLEYAIFVVEEIARERYSKVKALYYICMAIAMCMACGLSKKHEHLLKHYCKLIRKMHDALPKPE